MQIEKLTTRISKWLTQFDFGSWPAFLMFLVVTTLGVTLNYLVMQDIVGHLPAMLVALLFEAGIISWKLTSWRKKNSDAQDEISNFAVWISVVLAVIMLVVNLFRADIQAFGSTASGIQEFDVWTILAFVIIGTAALLHVVSYLLFDANDEDKKNLRKNEREARRLEQQRIESNNAIVNTEEKLKIIEKIARELERLRVTYKHLPVNELEFVLEEARKKLLAMYRADQSVDDATAGMSDINQDGIIGRPSPNGRKPMTAYASETHDSFTNPSDRS